MVLLLYAIIVGASGFGGMERWNGLLEWNTGMPHPLSRLCAPSVALAVVLALALT